MNKWEYMYLEVLDDVITKVNNEDLKESQELLPFIQKLGQDGWE